MQAPRLSDWWNRAFLGLLLLSIAATAQTSPTFSRQQYPAGTASSPYTADVNNDGVLDLLSPSDNHFVVIISNGNGTWQTPKNVAYPAGFTNGGALFAADLNSDGKVDVAVALRLSNTLAVYLGHGDGTFAAPKVTQIAAAAGKRFTLISGADFNHDGKIDLVASAYMTDPNSGGPVGSYYLMPGDGAGNYSAAQLIFNTPPGHYMFENIAVGDFDADGNADVAISDADGCSIKHCSVQAHILFGNGAFGFTTVTPSFSGSDFGFVAGDLNNDGKTDIVGAGTNQDTFVAYGRADRAMAFSTVTTPPGSIFFSPAIADFNGDGRNDIAGIHFRSTTSDFAVAILLQNSNGTFTYKDVALLGSQDSVSNVVAGDFNKNLKPDLALVAFGGSGGVLNELLNTTSGGDWGGCAYPSAGQGIHICAPGASAASPVTFNVSANSFQPIRKIELWIDGKKATEQFHVWDTRAWFRYSQSLAAGTHRATFFAANPDNSLLKTSMTFSVSSSSTCGTPSSSTGTVICSPTSGSTVSSPVNVQAKGGSSVKNMEAWVDGVRKYAGSGNTVSLSLSVAAGSHKLTIFSKNGSTVLSSAVSTFTVK